MGESVKLGTGRCVVCGSVKARYTLSGKGLAVITCNACNFQGFARSERSDELLRNHVSRDPEPTAAPAAAPVAAPAPADALGTAVAAGFPPKTETAAPAPAPRRSFMSW